MEPTRKQQPWILEGYQVFALEGPTGLKVERLSKLVGKNKSSFYHHFADLDIFVSVLLDHHIKQSIVLGEKEANCIGKDHFVQLMLEHKQDLLFSRQLRIHRDNAAFEKCFCRTNEISIPNFIPIWSAMIGLENNQKLAGTVLNLSMENFFLQITEDTLQEAWLHNYIDTIRNMVLQFS